MTKERELKKYNKIQKLNRQYSDEYLESGFTFSVDENDYHIPVCNSANMLLSTVKTGIILKNC